MESLQNARNEIDAIDQEMAKLFERRMKVCRGIAEYKRERALPIQDSAREIYHFFANRFFSSFLPILWKCRYKHIVNHYIM